MFYMVIFVIMVQGQQVKLFEPVQTLEECRATAAAINEKEKKEVAFCGAFVVDQAADKVKKKEKSIEEKWKQ
jgi:hypothetical protein